jgi:hypothetical protein
MDTIQSKQHKQIIETVYINDLDKQNSTFKQRLEEKRKKTLLSTSDITDQIESIVK